MKNLVKPTWIIAVLLVISGAVPMVPWITPVTGLCLLMYVAWIGIQIMGVEDRELNATLAQMRMAVSQAEEAVALAKRQCELASGHADRASKAVSDVRIETRLR